MTEDNKIENSLIPIGSTSLVRVNNTISITDKILKEYNFKLHNHKNLLTDNWDNIFPNEWKEILELHIILTKLDIKIDTKCSIHHQYKNLFNVDYTFNNKTDNNYLKKLKILNLRTSKFINDITPVTYFDKLSELNYYSESHTLFGIENIGKLTRLEKLHLYTPQLCNLDFLKTNIGLKDLSLITGKILDYSPLSELFMLERLFFATDKLPASHSVFKLTNLKDLDIINCSDVEDMELFSHLSRLEKLSLYYVNIHDINFLKRLQLKSLRIRNGGLINEDIIWLRENIQDLILI
ncbi:MAG: hypothetical protein IPG48_04540 [Saprospiraceae bacterium]|nr:hypothetical protein [Saprospiraceae bacterium]MBK6665426.1 hypothetical protein [Saprospiraceae bacterium]MBK7699570.1 hypothetical protein [Saprospiraceae bacterium]MBK8825667.1 hypothetical protein [Saprospiraceae bacterium]MBK9582823.1 hypothetical protein [Saprospiraceae bacterium]